MYRKTYNLNAKYSRPFKGAPIAPPGVTLWHHKWEYPPGSTIDRSSDGSDNTRVLHTLYSPADIFQSTCVQFVILQIWFVTNNPQHNNVINIYFSTLPRWGLCVLAYRVLGMYDTSVLFLPRLLPPVPPLLRKDKYPQDFIHHLARQPVSIDNGC